ncbi:MAG: hypothetical protein ACI92O_000443 [Colwellia sp.]|jgi:hypothetical protein
MIVPADELEKLQVINFGSAKHKKLGQVTRITALNPQMKDIVGNCLKTGNLLQSQEVNKQPICVFDEAYIKHYLASE